MQKKWEKVKNLDNAPCHTANIVKKWSAENYLTVLPWPGNSPDMNPIEDIWDIERRIQDIDFKNTDELLEKIQKKLNALPLEYLKKLIDSMPRRVNAILKASDGSTQYSWEKYFLSGTVFFLSKYYQYEFFQYESFFILWFEGTYDK